ncbi:MAG TPA: GNAT family N-acetyltransferase [Candidatus Polarisedimenticolaceae bacterium]|nr:GNAT family N-acetyltransferase [Candidatus Polarisedimenticolaceae bacterium]
MPRLELASRAQIDGIARESYLLWGGGLSLADYRELWDEVGATPWCRDHAAYYVWRDGRGRALSSMKVYRPALRLGDRVGRASVFGAVFTPTVFRRRGFASAMLAAGVERSREQGDLAALLFSDIGTRFYADLGFRALPAPEYLGRLTPGEPAVEEIGLRPVLASELELFQRAHAASTRSRPIAILRDAAHWKFLWVRSRAFFGRVRGAGIRHEWRIASRCGRFAGYVIAVEGRGEWNVREVASVDGDPRGMAAILMRAADDAYRRGCRRVYGWLPPDLADQLGAWSLDRRERRRAVPMLRPGPVTVDPEPLLGAPANHIPFQDQF